MLTSISPPYTIASDVDELAPATEVEPGRLARPAPVSGGEDAEVRQQDSSGRSARSPRSTTENPPSGPITRIGIAARMPTAIAAFAGVSERRVDAAPDAAERQVPVAAHREHHPGRRALDRQGAHEDRREDHEQVHLTDGDPGRRSPALSVAWIVVGDREAERLALRDRRGRCPGWQRMTASRNTVPTIPEIADRPEDAARRLAAGVDASLRRTCRRCRSRRRRTGP